MYVPAFPTDNLYKFLAISGIVIAIFCTWMNWSVQYQEIERVSKQYFASRERSDALDAEVSALESANAAALKGSAATRPPALAADSVGRAKREHEREVQARQEQISTARMHDQLRWLPWGQWLGALTSAAGFILWYVKLQRFQDRVLVGQARAALESSARPPTQTA